MSELLLEELESRQLLSGAATLFQPPPSQTLAGFSHSSMRVEQFFFMDYSGHVGTFSWGWSEGATADMSLVEIVFSEGPVDRDPVPPSSGQQEFSAAWPEIEGGQVRVASDHFATRPGATGTPAAAFLINGAVPTAAPDPAASRGVNVAATGAVLTMLSERPDFQSRLLPGNPGGGGALPAPVQNVPVQRSLNYAVPVIGDSSGGAGSVGDKGARLDNGSGAPMTVEQRDTAALPSPQVSDVLAVLPPFDLSGLEVGMQDFLKSLEQLAPHLAGDRGLADLWPWIVALAAAAAACEIGRRELRRAPEVPIVDTNRI